MKVRYAGCQTTDVTLGVSLSQIFPFHKGSSIVSVHSETTLWTFFLYLSAWQNWICPVCSAREQKVCIPIRTVGSPGTGQARGPSHLKDTPFNNLSGAQLCWAQWLKWSRKLRKCRKQRTVWKTQLLPGGSQPISGIFLFFPSKNIHVTSSFISYDRGKKKKKERRLPSVVLDTWKTYVSPGQYTKK